MLNLYKVRVVLVRLRIVDAQVHTSAADGKPTITQADGCKTWRKRFLENCD